MLSSILRSRTSVFKSRQSPAIQKIAWLSQAQTRFYTANHDDPFNDDADNAPPQHGQINPKLRDLINGVSFDRKVRYTTDGSENSHPTPDEDLLHAIFNPTTLPYTVGTDICDISRIHRLLAEQIEHPAYVMPDMPRFWTRVLTPIEARYSGWKNGGELRKNSTFISGRWAAKEAIIKAFSAAYPALDKIFMHDIVILNSKVQKAISESRKAASRISVRNGGPPLPGGGGLPADSVSRGAPRAFVRVPVPGVGWTEVSVSISHEEEYATAVALVPVDAKIAEFRKEKVVVREVASKTYPGKRHLW
ncbi:hypothetical protein V497_03162 [Pseudogymnoascus sp. VKM F-4516 (FW-969)]|nr:hypothetical protein V497_03162 [Pseudogymnoascus sp. VKM F-4516 (FW-969)]